jgi:hypothetical protein
MALRSSREGSYPLMVSWTTHYCCELIVKVVCDRVSRGQGLNYFIFINDTGHGLNIAICCATEKLLEATFSRGTDHLRD